MCDRVAKSVGSSQPNPRAVGLRTAHALHRSLLCRSLLCALIGSLLFASLACAGLRKKIAGDASKLAHFITLVPEPVNLTVSVTDKANDNSPVAVDVALIKDKNFWKSAQSMAAKDWFAQKDDLQRRYQSKLIVHSWEWVPGQPIPRISMKLPRGVEGAMIFANYQSPGSHSAPLPQGVKVSVALQPDDFTMKVNQ